MAVSSETYKHTFTGDGSTVTFNFTFAVFAEADVKVTKYTIADGTEDVLTLTSDYTVSLTDDGASGGSITLTGTAPSSDYKIILTRDLDYTQDTDWVENDPFLAATIEDAVDRLTMLTQQLKEQVDRSVLQDLAASSQITFPTPTTAGYLYFDGTDYNWGSTTTSVVAGDGMSLSGSTLSVDINGTTDLASPAVADELLLSDDDNDKAIRKADLLSIIGAGLKDEDDMTSNSATYGATQQSIKAYVDNNISSPIPSGVITMWSGAISNIPSGWVICDGTNGTPNLTDRFVIHADADSGGTNDVGDTGGANAHTLTEAELPSHNHSINHNHSISGYDPAANNALGAGSTSAGGERTITATHTGNSGTAGSGAAHENRPKYYALAYIMKT